MPVTNAQLLAAIKRNSDVMKRLVESIENMVTRQSMFGSGAGASTTKLIEIDLGDTNTKLDTLITHVDEIEGKQDDAKTELEAINSNTIAAGGQTAAESLINAGTSVAESLFDGSVSVLDTLFDSGTSIIDTLFDGSLSLLDTVLVGGATVFAAGGLGIAAINQLMALDIGRIDLNLRRSYHYAAQWDTVTGPGFFTMITEFQFNDEFTLEKFTYNRVAGTGPTPQIKLMFKDGEEGNIWYTFYTGPLALTDTKAFLVREHMFPATFVLRAELGVVWTGGGDIYTVAFIGKMQGGTSPTITTVTAETPTVFRDHTHT